MKHALLKSLSAIALATVLVFGAATVVRPSVAQAVTGSSNASLEETHIQLLLQIIELLKQQLAALKGAMGKDDTNTKDASNDDSDGDSCLDDSDGQDDSCDESLDDDDDDNDDNDDNSGHHDDGDDDDDNDDNDDDNN